MTWQSNRQGGARAVDLPARSFDLTRLGVGPPLNLKSTPKGMLRISSKTLEYLGLYFSPTIAACHEIKKTIINRHI